MPRFLFLLSIACLAGCSGSQTAVSHYNPHSNITSIASALEGREPGVLVNAASGAPGASPSIIIRGINSIHAGTEPLYVLDGVPYSGPLSMINPNDIESIKVLKNPEDISIYGVRGANGVVVITTKKGGAPRK